VRAAILAAHFPALDDRSHSTVERLMNLVLEALPDA
jgi:hypothetical protein